ncbi:MAG TPA: TRAFs-binding domain-containing protein [Spirochaetia bacterium]|nr:TRAFs-binding domain-containing protein [Spirochaetia bacterium]
MLDGNKENFESYLELNRDKLGSVIHGLWLSKDRSLWTEDPYFYIRLGALADKLGQVMFAHDILEEGLEYFPGNLRLIQLFCLSSIKCGFLLRARDMLVGLMKQGHEDEETLGILGRVYKEMWLIEDEANTNHQFLIRSRNLYLKAFLKNRGYYSGINAASLSLLAGDNALAGKLARHVLRRCSQLMRSAASPDLWVFATIGEACALLGRREESLAYYHRARKLAGNGFAELASMRRQLNLLRRVTTIAAEVLNDLRIPPVIAFTGHMVDAPGRRTPRFPSEIAGEVALRIGAALADMGGEIGIASAASGSDVIFLEAMQERGGETNIILPFDRDDFIAASVESAGVEWRQRVEKVLERSTEIEQVTRGKYEGDDVLFSYANQIIMGKTILRSRFLETDPILLAVWDGKQSKVQGGTGEFIHMWEKTGHMLEVINLREMSGSAVSLRGNQLRRSDATVKVRRSNVTRETVALLFADLVGYSRLTEEQVPRFIEGFLGSVASRIANTHYRPLFKNMWGDALYFVFAECEQAAECALQLRDMMRETDWSKLGLPAHLSMRIGLHAGPVFGSKEPFLNQKNFFGYHVNQAARIEPITSPGNVYASEHFAALLMGTGERHIECRYVGVIVLPKDFGSYPIYHLKRMNEIE